MALLLHTVLVFHLSASINLRFVIAHAGPSVPPTINFELLLVIDKHFQKLFQNRQRCGRVFGDFSQFNYLHSGRKRRFVLIFLVVSHVSRNTLQAKKKYFPCVDCVGINRQVHFKLTHAFRTQHIENIIGSPGLSKASANGESTRTLNSPNCIVLGHTFRACIGSKLEITRSFLGLIIISTSHAFQKCAACRCRRTITRHFPHNVCKARRQRVDQWWPLS